MNNPDLYDLIKLYMAEHRPELVVDRWEANLHPMLPGDQIRISIKPIIPFSEGVKKHSLIAISRGIVYYAHAGQGYWSQYECILEEPNFFEKLEKAIDIAIEVKRKKAEDELQKSSAD